MRLLGEGDKAVDVNDPAAIGSPIFEFDLENDDWMLKQRVIWDSVLCDTYTFRLGRWRFNVPSGVYIFTGCGGGSMDWIISDEIIGRQLNAFILPNTLQAWTLEQPVLERVQEDTTFYMPSAKVPMCLMDNTGEKAIIFSVNDHFHKLKDMDFNTLFVV